MSQAVAGPMPTAAVGKIAPRNEMKKDLCHASRDLLVTKATAVVVGITFDASCVTTLETLFDTSRNLEKLLSAVVLNLLLVVLCAVILKEIEEHPTLPTKLTQTYGMGVKLIPAWSYKGVVVQLTSFVEALGWLQEGSVMGTTVFGLIVGVISALFAIGFHYLHDHVKLDKSSIASRSIAVLDVSFALGAGYAVNQAF